jgi:two-component system, OmpR family, sensor kinase
MATFTPSPVRWYRSFYWRIGFSFFVFVIAVLVAQSLTFNYVLSRSGAFAGRSPNTLVAIIAADIGSTLAQNPNEDLVAYLQREYGRVGGVVYVVMKDGRMASNSEQSMPEAMRESVLQVLAGTDFRRTGTRPVPPMEAAPVVTAPIQIANELRGMVVMPPPPSAPGPVARDIGRILSVPGTALVIVATAIAALVIFGPARRRLEALEAAARRLGSGELTARAPESVGEGGDEIAQLSVSFNHMAAELAARDESLRAADRQRRQMLADVSHELKTPLTAMRGFVETLRMADLDLDARTRERYFETLERETQRLDRIVQDLLDLTRLEHGVSELDARFFAIRRVFEHVAQRHEVEAQAREISFDVWVADAADQVYADPDRIEQVIENLVANALRHTPDRGRIELYAVASDEKAVVSVVDSGSGIAPEHLPHVFDRFYKADASRAHAAGSGLGLSIAKAIVQRHRGTIDVTSRPGRTEFVITLPEAVPAAPTLAARNSA